MLKPGVQKSKVPSDLGN